MIDDPICCGRRAAWCSIVDAKIAIVSNDRVCDGEADRTRRRLNQDAVAGKDRADEILNHAVGDGEAAARVKNNAVSVCEVGSIEGHPANADRVARAGVDGDCCRVADWRQCGPAPTHNAKRMGDGQRAP
jgi:hypothetical protein